jgi:Zn finger protein HypA/HybF involved in hydrogenase expression
VAVRFCPKCKKNVVTKVLSAKCGLCESRTSPLDKTLKVPVDTGSHDRYTERRRKRATSIWS